MTRIGAAIVTMAVLLPTMPVNAMELRVISAGAVRGVVEGMIDDYSKKTGHQIQFYHRADRPVARHHRLRQAGRSYHRLGTADV